MKPARKLALKKETLAELTVDDLARAVGGDGVTHMDAASACGHPCFTAEKPCITIPLNGCVTIATICVTVA